MRNSNFLDRHATYTCSSSTDPPTRGRRIRTGGKRRQKNLKRKGVKLYTYRCICICVCIYMYTKDIPERRWGSSECLWNPELLVILIWHVGPFSAAASRWLQKNFTQPATLLAVPGRFASPRGRPVHADDPRRSSFFFVFFLRYRSRNTCFQRAGHEFSHSVELSATEKPLRMT